MKYIGVDLGGTNIAAGIVTEKGNILLKKSVPTLSGRPAEEIIKDIAQLCLELIKDSGLSISDIKSIGIGSPGSIDTENGIIQYSNNLNFNNVNIRDDIKKYIDIPVYIANDANCAALGESIAGASKGYKDSIAVTLGTGVGGGIIIDGKIFDGAFHGGGELGHHVIHTGGEQCTCGRKGCWEAYSSATALIRDARRIMQNTPNCEIGNIVNGDLSRVTAKTPFDAAEKNDTAAIELIDNYLQNVAEGIANLINIFQPEIIVIGGGVCSQGEHIRKPISDKVQKLIYGTLIQTKIAIAKLGNDAGIVGAAMLS